jgi:parallel beta-helix repeat protein
MFAGVARGRRRTVISIATVAGSLAVAGLAVSVAFSGSADAAITDPDRYTVTDPVAEDWFDRTVPAGLGSPPRGGEYTVWPQTAPLSVADSEARMTALAPGASAKATLTGVSVADVDTQWTVVPQRLPTAGSGLYSGTELRHQPTGTAYRAKANVGVGGAVKLSVSRVADGRTETELGTADPRLTLDAGQKLRVQARVTGVDPVGLAVRAWIDGTPTPAWQLRASDASATRIAATGAVGLWWYVSAGSPAMTFGHSSWTASRLGAPATPSPAAPSPSTSDAAPQPSPTPPPAGGGTPRGALPVGTAAYPVPAGAVFVATNGTDSAAGTEAAPLRTVSAAVAKAAAGGTIVVRAGTYHESVGVPKALTIQAYPREAVWFDGSSVVTGWTKQGNAWVHTGWTNQFDHSLSYTKGRDDPAFLSEGYPMAGWPDAVWIGGRQLAQVASAAQVSTGTFAVDYTARTLTVGTDPAGGEVRSADLSTAFTADAANVVLQGFGVRRYGTAIWQLGTVRLARDGDIARNVIVEDSATTGISFGGRGRAEHVTVTGAGMLGIHGNQADGLTITGSVVTGNNRERFFIYPVAGGIKVTRTRNLTITDNAVNNNVASTGIWLDESVVGFTVTGNSAIDNQQGIEVEISDTGIVANNEFSGGQRGLYVYNTGNVKVFNNSFAHHREGGAYLSQDARRQATHPVGRDPRMPVPDPSCPWVLRDVTFANNVFLGATGGGQFQFYVLDRKTNVPADAMNLTVTGNVFNPRTTGNDPYPVGWGGADNATVTRYATAAEFDAARGGANLLAAPAAVRDVARDNASRAVPLPADVAAAVGQSAGATHLGRF